MIVADVWKSVSDTLGTCDEDYLYDILSSAVELGSNKGLYDPLIGYLHTVSGSDNMVYLPREVDSIIKINIDGKPSFTRDRLFEFSLGTDGTVEGDTIGFTWDDRVTSPIQKTLVAPTSFGARAINPVDDGKEIRLFGIDDDGREVEEILTIQSVAPTQSVNLFSRINRIVKDETEYPVSLIDWDNEEYAYLYPDDVDPFYRAIRVSKSSAHLRIIYRKAYFKLSKPSDFIPLHHKMAVVMLCKAVKAYRDDNFDLAMACEEKGYTMLEERQASLSSALTAAMKDRVTATNQNIGVVEGIVVADIYDEAVEIGGNVGRQRIFDNITSAVKMLKDQALWDAELGFAHLATSDDGTSVVLPRYVDIVLAITEACGPIPMVNKWFAFHVGGTGNCVSCCTWQRTSDVVTINEVKRSNPLRLGVQALNPSDSGKEVTIYGLDDKGISAEETIVAGSPTPVYGSIKFSRIDRVSKQESDGFIRLFQVNDDMTEGALLGYYYPDELEPNYARIKISRRAQGVKMAFRRRQIKITGMQDFIMLRSREAILLTLRGIEAMKTDLPAGQAYIAAAVELLSAEQASRNPGDTPSLQIDPELTGTLGGGSIEFC